MIVDVNNFNIAIAIINKNRAILPADAKAVYFEMLWLQNFSMQAWMKRICFKNQLLLFKSLGKIARFKIF